MSRPHEGSSLESQRRRALYRHNSLEVLKIAALGLIVGATSFGALMVASCIAGASGV